MDVKKEMYRQRPIFQTGMPLFGAALIFLLPALCFCLRRNTFLLAVILLVIGLLLIMLGVGRIKGETKHILRFVQEKSNFYHKYDSPLIISGLLERLQKEGFEVAEYPVHSVCLWSRQGSRQSVSARFRVWSRTGTEIAGIYPGRAERIDA